MKVVTIAGPPSSGKTSVILKAAQVLKEEGLKIGVIKLDCLTTQDHLIYEKAGFEVKVGLAGNLCPDHYFVSNIEECITWGMNKKFDLLMTESAGLCNRCSPHIKEIKAVCVIDNLMGINTPQKIGPMLKLADLVVISKGDIVSQAEREVFAFRVRQVNPKATIFHVNGITGQGVYELSRLLLENEDLTTLDGKRLRFTMPAALCSYCLGEIKIGNDFQMGNVRKMNFGQE
ncbi:GTP-binding protein [Niallia sp. 01092]|uniref:GTP-binding protein n=1 Tax=unclassified Niallia TaxID=2837522 RepID=UPI003FD04F2D